MGYTPPGDLRVRRRIEQIATEVATKKLDNGEFLQREAHSARDDGQLKQRARSLEQLNGMFKRAFAPATQKK